MGKIIERIAKLLYKQPAVYWGVAGKNEYGEEIFQNPIELSVLATQKDETIFDYKNEAYVSHSQIMTTELLQLGGYVYMGRLSDLTEEQKKDPRKIDGVMVIRKVEAVLVPILNEYVRRYYL